MAARNGSSSESLPGATSMERVSDRELVITRAFRAPSHRVFEAWTRPEFVRRWWAPESHGVTMVDCTADVRAGGAYRYLLRKGSQELGFSGTYTEVTPPTRLVYTHRFEQSPDEGVAVVTVTFDERDGVTRLRAHELYPSKQVLDAVLATGMEAGMRETLDQLDALLGALPSDAAHAESP